MASKIPTGKTRSVRAAKSPPAVEAELPYAIIEHTANNSLLYPIDAIDGTTATLTLPANATNVMFYMAVKDQDQPSFEPISVENGVNVVDIPARWISYCIGHTVLIKYTANAAGRALESLTLELEIQQIREEHLVVSRPVFTHAKEEWSTWYLRMQEFTGDEIVAIKAWPMIQPGQRLFVVVAGNQHVAPYRFAWVAKDHVVQEHEAHPDHVFRFTLSRGWLSRLDDYSAITAHLGVIWDTTAPVYPEPGDPLLENPLPVNAEDFHLRTTSLLQVDPAQELNPPYLRESVELPPGEWQLNPVNTVNGGHAIVSYAGMFENDHVCAYASGPGYGPVALGCKDVNEGQTSLSFDVAPLVIAALFNKTMVLNYSVQFNHYQPQSSPDRRVHVLAPRLTLPCIEEATVGIVDLGTFSGNATAVVPVWDYAKEDEWCWMWVIGTREDGSNYRFDVLQDQPLTAQWLANGVDTPIPRYELKKLADCTSFELHFAASFDGKRNRATAIEFPMQVFSISQEDLVLNAPTVTEAVGNDLTPWNGRNGVHVEVDYAGINPDHTLTANWHRPDGSLWPQLSQPGSTSGPVIFEFPRHAVIESIGKTVPITYTVVNACKQQTSNALELRIAKPLMTRRPHPMVRQATPQQQNGIVDLRTFDGDAEVFVKNNDPDSELAWWFILAGQIAYMTCTGTGEDGRPYSTTIMHKEPVQVEDLSELSRMIPRAELEKFKDKTDLEFTFKCTTDESPVESDALEFQSLKLQFRKRYRQMADFNSGTLEGWEVGTGAPDPRDISLEPQADGFAVKNYTYTTRNIGPILQKRFTDLEPGHTYKFSVRLRRFNSANPTPKLSLRIDTEHKTSVLELVDLAWHTLSFKFVASTTPALLDIYSHEMDAWASGNDYLMDDFLVEEV
ncbi:carbohydrate binding domain-containing protein [Pseudomonas orientalis]|uniref:carbohydrate binding domain-containing protein n=1 Tax=Pseudomonas orientalis TaxID=76758 RepID=UPI0034D5B17B